MPTILLVEKNGDIKEQTVKPCAIEDLYKKAKLKSGEGFECHTTWNLTQNGKTYRVSLYGKLTGRAGQENKYDFPPPVDKLLFFGNGLLLNQTESGEMADLTSQEWDKIYETLFGGFEDIGSEDSEEEAEEEDVYVDIPKTRVGYAKDGFVVDDDEDEDDDYEPPKSPKKPRKKAVSKKATKPVVEEEELQNEVLVCSDELEEEEYFA
jgi:hypothetical protein